MGVILSGVWQDPGSVLIGVLRRLTRRAHGHPRPNETGMRLDEQARMARYIPHQLIALAAEYPRYPQPLFERAAVGGGGAAVSRAAGGLW